MTVEEGIERGAVEQKRESVLDAMSPRRMVVLGRPMWVTKRGLAAVRGKDEERCLYYGSLGQLQSHPMGRLNLNADSTFRAATPWCMGTTADNN